MKSSFLARLLVLAAALAISVTPGCSRKAGTPITPLPSARAGGPNIDNPKPVGPGNLAGGNTPGGNTDRSGRLPADNGARATDVTNNAGAGNTTEAVKPPPPGENVALADGPLDRSKFNENRSQFAADIIFFDFDSAVVKSSEKTKITAIVDFLKSNANAALEVEGHCDERGTEEYNRSLGERRALAVREELAQAGIDPKRIFTISYGEDRPAVNGHDEAAYSKNRRGESVLLTPR